MSAQDVSIDAPMHKHSPESLRSLYADHHGWLTGWLTQKLGCPHNASDLTQDTFVRVITRCEPATVTNHRPWLLTIAKRLLIDKSRRFKLEQAYLEALKEQPQIQSAPSSEELLFAVQTLEQIAQVLDSLAEKPRKAFVLRNIEGLTQADIAVQLGVSNTMVRNYLVQGLVACHDLIDGNLL